MLGKVNSVKSNTNMIGIKNVKIGQNKKFVNSYKTNYIKKIGIPCLEQ